LAVTAYPGYSMRDFGNGLLYDIEFIRRVDGNAEAVALDVVRLVSDTVASVIAEADELFKKLAMVPRPDGYRIRESDGSVVYEFVEAPDA
jgi:hypothetical protein